MSRYLFNVNLGNVYSQYAALIRWKDWMDMLRNSSLSATKKLGNLQKAWRTFDQDNFKSLEEKLAPCNQSIC